MERYAIIDGSDVINVIEYDAPPSNPPPGFDAPIIAVQSDVAGPGWTYINEEFVAPAPKPIVVPLQAQAITALDVTDMVAARCFKASVAYPADWQSYTVALRNIANGTDKTSTQLPTQPVYPAGT